MNWILLFFVTSTLVHFGIAQRGYSYDKPSKPFSTNNNIQQENYPNQQNFPKSEQQSNNGQQSQNRFSPSPNGVEQQNYPNQQNKATPQSFNQNNFPKFGPNKQTPEGFSSKQNKIEQHNFPNAPNQFQNSGPTQTSSFPRFNQNQQSQNPNLNNGQTTPQQPRYQNGNNGKPVSKIPTPQNQYETAQENDRNSQNQLSQNTNTNNFQTTPQQPKYQNGNNGKSVSKSPAPQNQYKNDQENDFNSQIQITPGNGTPSRQYQTSQTTPNQPQPNKNLKPQQKSTTNQYSNKGKQNKPVTQSTQSQDDSESSESPQQSNRDDNSENPQTGVPLDSRNSNGPEKSNQDSVDEEEYESSYAAIPGEPDTDYPIYSEVPETSFKCTDQQYPGYYADVEARCQVFHICTLNQMYDFLCPNGTIFHQEYLVCVWWNQFDCSSAPGLYEINAYIYSSNQTQNRFASDNNVNIPEDGENGEGPSIVNRKQNDKFENDDQQLQNTPQGLDVTQSAVKPTDSNSYTGSKGGQVQDTKQSSGNTRIPNNGYPTSQTGSRGGQIQDTKQSSGDTRFQSNGYPTSQPGSRGGQTQDTKQSSGDTRFQNNGYPTPKTSNGFQTTQQISNKGQSANVPGLNTDYGTTPDFRNTYQTIQPQTPFSSTNNFQGSNSNFRSPTSDIEKSKSETATSTPQSQFPSITPAYPSYQSQPAQNFRRPSHGNGPDYSQPQPDSRFSKPGVDTSRTPLGGEESTQPNYQNQPFGTQPNLNQPGGNREGYQYNPPRFGLSTSPNNIEQPGREYLPPYTG